MKNTKDARSRRSPARPCSHQWLCVFISTAARWREKGHRHWFVCKKCLRRIAKGETDWTPEGFTKAND
jgi:hypothetical protein